jgi:hypothetical protein
MFPNDGLSPVPPPFNPTILTSTAVLAAAAIIERPNVGPPQKKILLSNEPGVWAKSNQFTKSVEYSGLIIALAFTDGLRQLMPKATSVIPPKSKNCVAIDEPTPADGQPGAQKIGVFAIGILFHVWADPGDTNDNVPAGRTLVPRLFGE